MAGSQSVSSNPLNSDKVKATNQRDFKQNMYFESMDEETNHAPIKKKTPKKRVVTNFESLTTTERKAWMHEKAAASIIPTEENAVIKPSRLFKGWDPLIIHICEPCRVYNSVREATEVEKGMVQIPLALCTICRSHLLSQKNTKFYQFDCPALKKKLNL